jgi:hypothetical protein
VTGGDGQYFLHHDLAEQIAFFGVGQVRRPVEPDQLFAGALSALDGVTKEGRWPLTPQSPPRGCEHGHYDSFKVAVGCG